MTFWGKFWSRRKSRKQEGYADNQYLDALEIIKETTGIYLDLLAHAKQYGHDEDIERLESKLNSHFEYYNKNWDGEVNIVHTISSNCSVEKNKKRLKVEKK